MSTALVRSVAGSVAGLALLAGTASAAGPFTDPAGDSGSAADVTAVSVSNDASGQITFQLTVASPLASTDSVAIFLDTDQSAATGDQATAGAEYVFSESESDQSFGVGQWSGSNWQDAAAPTASVKGGSGTNTLTFSINASDLGGVSGFNFWVGSIDGDGGAGHQDEAPDSATWNYQLTRAVVQLQAVVFTVFTPARAGRSIQAVLVARRSDTGAYVGAEGTLACAASVGGRKLAGVPTLTNVSVSGEQVPFQTCTWRLPKNTRGKILRGTITVTYQGASAVHSFSVRVR